MGVFDFLKANDINRMVSEMPTGAALVDVREHDEYQAGHIPGAKNYPLSILDQMILPWEPETVLYVYCLSGARSGRAVQFLKEQGYSNVMNIGGINSWRGEVEK